MSIILKHDNPSFAAALAAGVGTLEGRALVDRAVYEQEVARRQRLEEQATAAPSYAGGSYRDESPLAYARFAEQQRANDLRAEQEAQRLANQSTSIDIRRDQGDRRIANQAGRDAVRESQGDRRLDLSESRYSTLSDQGDRRLGQQDRSLDLRQQQGDRSLDLRQRAIESGVTGRDRAAAQRDRSMDQRDHSLRIAERAAGRRSAGVEAASQLLKTIDAGGVAYYLAPASSARPLDQNGEPVLDPLTGLPTEYTDSERAVAVNMARAIAEMPFETDRDGLPAYSLPQLVAKADEFVKAGVPDEVLAPLVEAINDASERVKQADADFNRVVTERAASLGPDADPRTVEAIEIQALAEAADSVGMSMEQYVEAIEFMAGKGRK